jgi:hypothetical protein
MQPKVIVQEIRPEHNSSAHIQNAAFAAGLETGEASIDIILTTPTSSSPQNPDV